MRGPLFRLAAFVAAFASPAVAAGPKCPPQGSGGVSTNWGPDYRERVRDIFETAKAAAGDGIDPKLALIFVNDLPKQGSTRMVDGSPLSALQKGTLDLKTDAVIYTFGVFEIACDEAQLATFMLHEMKHIKRGPDGRNHLDRVNACRKKIADAWLAGTDLSAYPDTPAGHKAVLDAFQAAKGNEVSVACVKPVENEADAFALEKAKTLPYKLDADPSGPDANRDARVQAFKNAEKWLDTLGVAQDDPGHGTLAERAETARRAAVMDKMLNRQKSENESLQSLSTGF